MQVPLNFNRLVTRQSAAASGAAPGDPLGTMDILGPHGTRQAMVAGQQKAEKRLALLEGEIKAERKKRKAEL